jgi:hypothetical protein
MNDTIVELPSITFMSHCPKCNRVRPVSLKRSGLLEKLASDQDVGVLNGVCGHEWKLSPEEKKNVRRSLAEGTHVPRSRAGEETIGGAPATFVSEQRLLEISDEIIRVFKTN